MSDEAIGRIYDTQSSDYAHYADERFAWRYLERPAYDRYLDDLYQPTTRVLDIGCGNGLVARHLISRGVDASNITGVDPSRGQIEKARQLTPDVKFEVASADTFEVEPGSLDLVITNTILHHLDNGQLEAMLTRIYEALRPGGFYFFVEVDPDHSKEGIDPANQDRWTTVKTPWGTEVPFFNRHPSDLMDALDRHGFDMVAGWPLQVAPQGRVEPVEYARYAGRPSRMAARFMKMPERTRLLRLHDVQIPGGCTTPEELVQIELAEKYFEAWATQSPTVIENIFAEDAVYEEKPGLETPLVGISAILEYWQHNPVSQQHIRLEHAVIGHSDDGSIWLEFNANFDVRDESVSLAGIIQLTIDSEQKKIVRLTEYFTTEKSPLEPR